MKTRSQSCARLEFALAVSTLFVCAGIGTLIPLAPPLDPGAAGSSIAAASFDKTPDAHDWTADRAALDSPDSTDVDIDDDGDGDGGAPGAIQAAPRPTGHVDLRLNAVHVKVDRWSSHLRDGHSLRGPPSGNQKQSDVADVDDDDDDDSFGSDGSSRIASYQPPAYPLSRFPPDHTLSPAGDRQFPRAP